MVIKQVELETVCGITSRLPENLLPEVAFAGKSNVGKSSLINALMNRKSYAKTSSQPGKTQTINFYNINQSMYLVDLPGYGYTKIAESEKRKPLNPADRKHAPAQRNLPRHCHIGADLTFRDRRKHSGRHRNTGGRSVFWNGAFRNMDMNIVFPEKLFRDLILLAYGTDITDACLRRFFHHIPQLSGQTKLSFAGHQPWNICCASR